MSAASTLNADEIAKFSAIADQWWDESGDFAPLHRINPVRLRYIREIATRHFQRPAEEQNALSGLSLVDIGCGGGLVAEPMARMDANVTAIDGSERNIKTAIAHQQQTGVQVDYRCTSAEELAATNQQFDIVLALEIVEHVDELPLFLQSVCKLVKPGGLLIISTLNRTLKAYALGIIGAEYILRWLPRGTHDWKKFLKPHEIIQPIQQHGLELLETKGMVMNPLNWQWSMSDTDIDVNYYVSFAHPST